MTVQETLKTPKQIVSDAKAGVTTCAPHEAAQRVREDPGTLFLLDVREPAEYEAAHIATATNIPRGLLEWKIADAFPDRNQPLLVHCGSGGRAILAAKTLREMGYNNVTAVDGGYDEISSHLSAEFPSQGGGEKS